MLNKLELLGMAQSLAQHAGQRQALVAQNVANADTAGYKAKDYASFGETYKRAQPTEGLRTTRAGHVFAGESRGTLLQATETGDPSSPNGNSVSLETEMMRGAEVRQQHDLALAVFRSSLTILRTSSRGGS